MLWAISCCRAGLRKNDSTAGHQRRRPLAALTSVTPLHPPEVPPMFRLGPRTRRAVAAVVFDPQQHAFLLVFNPRWHAYTLPTRRFPDVRLAGPLQERAHCEQLARQALRDDL